jgi:hypothetical protein
VRLTACVAAAWLALAPGVLADETSARSFFEKLAGEWQGKGVVNGNAAEIRMHWEPVLDGQFLRLSMENRMILPDGKTWPFLSQAFYRIGKDGAIAGNWFDSRGISLPLAGSVDGDSMTILWGTEASAERGRSSYRLAADALEVTDEVANEEGAYEVFGRTRLARKMP